MLRRMKP
jgi:hypothetical protein